MMFAGIKGLVLCCHLKLLHSKGTTRDKNNTLDSLFKVSFLSPLFSIFLAKQCFTTVSQLIIRQINQFCMFY